MNKEQIIHIGAEIEKIILKINCFVSWEKMPFSINAQN